MSQGSYLIDRHHDDERSIAYCAQACKPRTACTIALGRNTYVAALAVTGNVG